MIIGIIGIYEPNEDNVVTVKNEFFANLNKEIVKSGSGRRLILMGDMNGRKNGDSVVGNFREDMVNDNGERLNDYVHKRHWKYRMGFLNTKISINIHGSKIQKTWKLLLII